MKKITVDLPQGGTMEVEYSPLLIEQIRTRYQLGIDQEVTPAMIRQFVITEVESAIEKETTDAQG